MLGNNFREGKIDLSLNFPSYSIYIYYYVLLYLLLFTSFFYSFLSGRRAFLEGGNCYTICLDV